MRDKFFVSSTTIIPLTHTTMYLLDLTFMVVALELMGPLHGIKANTCLCCNLLLEKKTSATTRKMLLPRTMNKAT